MTAVSCSDKSDKVKLTRSRVSVSTQVLTDGSRDNRKNTSNNRTLHTSKMTTRGVRVCAHRNTTDCFALTVAMNCMILTNIERGMFFGNTPLCRGNRVSTTILRSLQAVQIQCNVAKMRLQHKYNTANVVWGYSTIWLILQHVV